MNLLLSRVCMLPQIGWWNRDRHRLISVCGVTRNRIINVLRCCPWAGSSRLITNLIISSIQCSLLNVGGLLLIFLWHFLLSFIPFPTLQGRSFVILPIFLLRLQALWLCWCCFELLKCSVFLLGWFPFLPHALSPAQAFALSHISHKLFPCFFWTRKKMKPPYDRLSSIFVPLTTSLLW